MEVNISCSCCPLLALHSDCDEDDSAGHPRRIAARAAGHFEVAMIEDCGQILQRDQPEPVVRFLLDTTRPDCAS